MKLFKLTFLLFTLLSVAACGDDEEVTPTCEQADWVGTYTATTDCTSDQSESVVLTVTAVGTDSLVFAYVNADNSSSLEIGPLSFDGCDIDLVDTEEEVTLTANLNNSSVMLTIGSTDATAGPGCTISGTRN